MKGHVIEDQINFSINLGFNSIDELRSSAVFGILSGTATGAFVAGAIATSATATALASLGVGGKIGLALGLVTLPATVPIAIPIITGAATAIGVGTLTHIIKKKKFTTYRGYRSFNTNIDRLGDAIAGKIFVPVIELIKELNREDYSFVREEMEKWGYSKEYIDFFLTGFGQMDISKIKDFIQNYDPWLKEEMKKKEKKINKKDIDIASLNSKIEDMLKRYSNEFGGLS